MLVHLITCLQFSSQPLYMKFSFSRTSTFLPIKYIWIHIHKYIFACIFVNQKKNVICKHVKKNPTTLHGEVSEICLNAFPIKEWKLHKDIAFPLSFLKLTALLFLTHYNTWNGRKLRKSIQQNWEEWNEL